MNLQRSQGEDVAEARLEKRRGMVSEEFLKTMGLAD